MLQARRFHANFLFFLPLTQGVLLIIFLDFCKNAGFFVSHAQNLAPYTYTTIGNGQQIVRPKDSAYLAAQYVYAVWLVMMTIKAVIGFRANLRFTIRWMSIYNILLGIDTGFEFIHTTLGVLFQDTSQLDDAAIIRRYCVSYLILLLQIYGFFCCYMHLKWVHVEMPQLFIPTRHRETLYELMIPMALRRSRGTPATDPEVAIVAATNSSEAQSPMAEVDTASAAVQGPSTSPGRELV